jgi:uncharacterized membrane protein
MLKNRVMRTNPEIRKDVQTHMEGNWTNLVVISLVFCLIATFTRCSFPLVLFVYCPLALGFVITMMHFVRRTKSVSVEDLFSAFNAKFYWKSMGLGILVWVYTFLWSLLFLVPGVIKGCSYFLAPYILVDNPELTAEEAICRSMRMMDGHKMQLFLMTLGYALFVMLSSFLFCIPLLWVVPYYNAVFAKFYEEVKNS